MWVQKKVTWYGGLGLVRIWTHVRMNSKEVCGGSGKGDVLSKMRSKSEQMRVQLLFHQIHYSDH
jgi:hypothetical protein